LSSNANYQTWDADWTRRFLLDLIEHSGAVIFVKDREGRYELVNQRWVEVTGLSQQEVLGRTDDVLFPGFVGDQFHANDLEAIESGRFVEKEEVLGNEDHRRHFLTIKFPLRDNRGVIRAVCGVATEITERKRAEREREVLQRELSEAQKMESVGRLAGGVAHDFNNMLSVILGRTEMALEQVSADSPLRAELVEIRKAAQRSARLTNQLLAFARKQMATPVRLELNGTIEAKVILLRRFLGEGVELSWRPASELWLVNMDPGQVDQILANLCLNARDAMPSGGTLIVETRNISIDPTSCSGQRDEKPGDYVMLAVSDNGHGMDSEILEKIFEPFFTTKEHGKGIGLGLPTVYGIVKQNGGFIRVFSQSGQGSRFDVFLPRCPSDERRG
jgi:two-component system, cell cycle sensor histidine kinase and response regulator CckA